MENRPISCLFMPGLPGIHKDYLFLQDLALADVRLEWLTYTGTYERSHQGAFTFEQCVKDVILALEALEGKGEPYFVIAYSFSTYIIRSIDFSRFPGCTAVLMFSPILSLGKDDIKQPFHDLLDYLSDRGDVNISSNSWRVQAATDDERKQSLIMWCNSQEKSLIPTFIFVGEQDDTGLTNDVVLEVEGMGRSAGSTVRFLRDSLATHKLDSYYHTSARAFLWAVIGIASLKRVLNEDYHYYLWGSLINSNEWTHYSDIDVLVIGNIPAQEYGTIAKIRTILETAGGIHFGVSVNSPEDLERTTFIRRNRGVIFLHELKHEAVSFGRPIAIRSVNISELKADALNVNKILRAQISKDLLAYYKNPSVAKDIIKSFIQAVRLTGYSRGQFIAVVDTPQYTQQIRELLLYAVTAKKTNYTKVSFGKLYEISEAMNLLVADQEK